jgi:hypothetical protein
MSRLTEADFEAEDEVQLAGELRYKKLASYLSTVAGMSLKEFEENHENGFFVERFQSLLDKGVVFQFGTIKSDRREILDQFEKTNLQTDILETRAIEIRKKNSDTSSNIITIGRAPDNDIVIYDKMVSKFHASLYISSPKIGIYVVDIGSTNATYLNNQKLVPYKMYVLSDGDEMIYGVKTRFLYLSAAALYRFLSELISYYS